MSGIDADDLALLANGFESAMRDAASPTETVTAIHDLGWVELLDAAPGRGIATTFTLLGSTASSAGLLDDVASWSFGRPPTMTVAVVFPRPGSGSPPARRIGNRIEIDGLASTRFAGATRAILPVGGSDRVDVVEVEPSALTPAGAAPLDPDPSYRPVRGEIADAITTPLAVEHTWNEVVTACRAALAHELLGAARTMLELARQHTVDREQFGRPVATFQALRHKLADAFAQIEGAAAVAEHWEPAADPLIAALAKSLAGQAARTTGTHAQQALAGIGFTAEHDFHRFLKRTLVLDQLFGSARTLPTEIGRELVRRGDAPRLVEL